MGISNKYKRWKTIMGCKVLIPQDIVEEGKAWLRERGYEIKMGSGATLEDIARDVVDCDAVLARTAMFPAKVLEAGRKLKVIARHGVGYDNVDVAKATELGIWVTFAPESNAGTVAEYTIGCIIALARNLTRSDREMREGNWNFRDQMVGWDLEDKVLGIAGMGKIGRRVAKKAAFGLEMKVIGYDPYLAPEQFHDHAIPAKTWEELLSTSDFVTLHLPGSPKTKGVVGKRELSLMKKSAFLINAARGDIVNEADLIEALRKGTIAGAALDVYAKEPPDPDNPLFSLENVLTTPHNSAHTQECMTRMALHAAQGIDEVLTGKRPTWPVNEISERRSP
jgi:D-3-phosphoglycerate dehydrogenase / 2-oxoglutarate reductase